MLYRVSERCRLSNNNKKSIIDFKRAGFNVCIVKIYSIPFNSCIFYARVSMHYVYKMDEILIVKRYSYEVWQGIIR
jgi:hypothetical protein